MCTTATIQKNIVRLGTRSFLNRMEVAGGGFDSARKLANLNRSLDKLYDCIYDESENMKGAQYNEFAPQLQILISTIKELYTCCRKSSFKEDMREEISELSKNYSALYELYADLRRSFSHKDNRLVDSGLSGKVATALKAIWMIACLSISNFSSRVQSLLDVKRGVYKGVVGEVENAFKGKDIEEIRQNRDMILQQDGWKIIKLRLPDKKQHLSKRDGYRLIYLVSMTESKIILLDIYPKNGPSQQLDIEDSEIIRLLNEFISEQEAGALSPFLFSWAELR